MTYRDYVGRTETRADVVAPVSLRALAATLDLDLDAVSPGQLLPRLWHWMLFQDWAPASGLGTDGHALRGGFLPPVHHLPRRMWAGGRLRFVGELFAGDTVTRASTILRITEKTGASGPLVFVTVGHVISGPHGPAINEEHEIVYRGVEGPATRTAEPAPAIPPKAVRRTVRPDAVLLFRYSALTGNGHRIHYDLDYTRNVEGYPGLVVHGPLQATWLAELARAAVPDRQVVQFTFRGVRPAFHDAPLTLAMVRAGDTLALQTRDASGAVCMQAEATLG